MALANVPVLSNHYDGFLSGANTQEMVLTPANVNATNFGALFNYAVDGYTYAQPLYVPNLTVAGGTHNVVFAATQHDSVYAFDADGGGQLWHRSFIDPANGITSVPQPDVISADIVPEIGITGTPVIDDATDTMYVVAKTKEMIGGTAHYVHRLHALDITTGQDRATGGVITIGDTTIGGPDGGYTNVTPIFVTGSGAGTDGRIVRFNSLRALQRPALQLHDGVVYVSWASHGDNGPYHGWLVGFDTTTLEPVKIFNATPGTSGSGIWQSGGAPAVDAEGNLYFAMGNGFNFAGREPYDSGNNGPSSLGGGGGGLGYQSIDSSAAVTFRTFPSQIGLGINGTFQPGAVAPGAINFNNGADASSPHTYRVDLTYNGTALSGSITDTTTGATFTLPSQAINLPQIVGGNTAWVGFTGATGGLNAQQDVLTWTYTPASGAGIDHSLGFGTNSDLKANGSASFAGTVARLTPAANGQTGSIFSRNQVNVASFSTSFTFQMVRGSNPIADGITFTIQSNQPDFSEAVMKLSTTGQLTAVDHFVPFDWRTLDQFDADLGSGGTMLLPTSVGDIINPVTGQRREMMVETGKSGKIYVMDRNDLGGNNPNFDRVRQVVQLGPAGVWGNPAFFQDGPNTGLIYYQGSGDVMKAFRITDGVMTTSPVTQSNTFFNFPGSQPSISANGTTNAIAWGLEVDDFGQNGPAVLHAYNAQNLQQELYTSAQTGLRDRMGGAVKFTFPIVTNGKVFAGANGSLTVFGLFPEATTAPAAPSNLAGTALSGTQIRLTWTNNATNATGVKIFRSTDGVNFTQVNTVARDVATYTDSGLTPSTLYHYQVVATNQVGDSAPSNTEEVRTRIAAPVLAVADVCVGAIELAWSGTANDHYDVKRSTDGTTFTVIATVPASQTTFTDTGLANGTYFYQVMAFSTFPDGSDTSDSNIVKSVIGPINIVHGDPNSGVPGFTDHSDMVANGSAQFTNENLLRLNNNFGQAGSAHEVQRVGIRGFTTSFQVRLHEGTQPNPADGFTFVIQTNSPTALGGGGGALGYQGIANSVAIKFDVFNNEGETANSTGIFFNGGFPGLPHNPGEVNIALNPANVNLRSQSVKTITLMYDGTTLTQTIHDPTPGQLNNGDFTTTYNVDIAGRLGADTAFVGFTGGTGGLFSLQDVLNWTYNEQEENLPPRAPSNLQVTDVVRRPDKFRDVTIAWDCNNAYTAQNFVVERSTDGVNFTQLATVPVTQTTFTDQRLTEGTYYYRVRSANAVGTSRPSNVDSVFFSGGQSRTVIEHDDDFNAHSDLTANGRASFTPNADPVGIFPGHQDIGNVAARGGATFDGLGTYSVRASGADIWDTTDSFHYVYKPLTGDGEIVARVTQLGNTDFWAKGGVMMREDLSAGARNAFAMATHPGGEAEAGFQWRTNPMGGTADSRSGFGTQPRPVWLRVVRSGDDFSSFHSRDGVTWVQQGPTVHIDMADTIYVGLALTAHNNDGRINTSMFDNVTITGNTSETLPPTAARLTDGGFSQAGSVFTNNRIGITNFTTRFTFQITPGTTPMADGMAFVIQGVGPTALGPGGGGLGYGSDFVGGALGIQSSVAIKFDIFNNSGEGINSTGIFTGGRSPTVRQPGLSSAFPDASINLDGTGINLASTHPFRVDLSYDGTTLTETIRDTVTNAQFTTSYVVNIPNFVGSNLAYVGFTGGTGGLTAVMDVQSWTFKTSLAEQQQMSAAGGESALTLVELTSLETASATLSNTSTSAPLLTNNSASDRADVAVPPDTNEDWLDAIAAVGTKDKGSDAASDELFSQLGDESDVLHVLATTKPKCKR